MPTATNDRIATWEQDERRRETPTRKPVIAVLRKMPALSARSRPLIGQQRPATTIEPVFKQDLRQQPATVPRHRP
jgi:hypothetical protein